MKEDHMQNIFDMLSKRWDYLFERLKYFEDHPQVINSWQEGIIDQMKNESEFINNILVEISQYPREEKK